jgi:hypothetical protein
VADRLVARERERIEQMSVEERMHEALALGERAIELLMQELGIDRREARRVFERERQRGRRPSVAMSLE